MAVTVRVIIIVQGRIQGVDYRAACVQHARLLSLCGWVRSRRGGAAEAFLAGPETNALSVQEWIWEGPDSTQATQPDVITGNHEAPIPGSEIHSTV